MPMLIAAFFVTALLYASVGFGGGSTYSALLALSGIDYRVLPIISLCCNLVVVLGGTIRFARAGVMPWRPAAVLTVIAAPAAFVGGLTPIEENAFMLLLGASLVLTAATMLLPVKEAIEDESHALARLVPLAAAPLGYLAGIVGIGGGIFLAPLLHLTRWDNPRAIAATASLFILVNSLFGLAGQLFKGGEGRIAVALDFGLPLLLAVAIGGQIGSWIAVHKLPQKWIRWGTALLVFWVGFRLLTT